jgi:serine protease AprX
MARRTKEKTEKAQQPNPSAKVERERREVLPILDVLHPPRELRQKLPGGSPRKIFGEGLSRREAAQRWEVISANAIGQAKRVGLSRGVVKVILKEEALAKSHRPHYLLEQAGRNRVIGALDIGELLVSVTDGSISATAEAMLYNVTQNGTADVSTIAAIKPVTESDVLRSPETSDQFATGAVLTLFDYLNGTANEEAVTSFRRSLQDRGLTAEVTRFNRWVIRDLNASDLRSLSGLPMVREVSPNTRLSVPASHGVNTNKAVTVAQPNKGVTYSTVGLLDTGISAAAAALKPWLAHQSNFIVLTPSPPPEDYSHATFIAGLMVQAASMNGNHLQMPTEAVRIHDVRVFSEIERSTEADVLARIDDAVRAAPHIKVWNLSLGLTRVERGVFSQFARDIDAISAKHGVLFVIAAGNYNDVPLRPWPVGTWPTGDRDLITPPADSALSISVGAVAHNDDPVGAVAKGKPVPYTRRGPGPAAIPKPEVVHFGGNCTLAGGVGGSIASLCPYGTLIEEFGTSYAAPLVASMGARIWDRLSAQGYTPTPELIKAFLIHSAAIGTAAPNPDELPFVGFGLPGQVDDALLCSEDTFTTLHSVYIPKGQQIHHKFAMPACLTTNGRFRGDITVTLCYAPILNERDGTEYCRSNVSVALGTLDLKKGSAKREFRGKLPPDPSAPKEALEKRLIEHGFKWSPVKVYRKRFVRGIVQAPWELRFDVLYRAGEKAPDAPQLAHALVTVRGVEEGLPVYRDGVKALTQASHTHAPVWIPQRTRVR